MNSKCSVRPGFSLIEMLIVMGILVLFAAFALPSLFGPLDKSRLRGGARDVQAALGKARSQAIREGRALEFRYEPGGSRWKIAHRDAVPQMHDTASMTSSGLQPEANQPGDGPDRKLVREGRLPEGTSFGAADDSGIDNGLDSPRGAQGVRWSKPIVFHPNGRSEDAELQVAGNRDFVVAIALRGLTSAVSYSEPFRRRTSDSELITDGTSGDRSVRGLR